MEALLHISLTPVLPVLLRNRCKNFRLGDSVFSAVKRLDMSPVIGQDDTFVFLIWFFVPLLDRYDIPQYGSQRRLITPVYDEYGEVIMEDDGYYYGPRGPEVLPSLHLILTLFDGQQTSTESLRRSLY